MVRYIEMYQRSKATFDCSKLNLKNGIGSFFCKIYRTIASLLVEKDGSPGTCWLEMVLYDARKTNVLHNYGKKKPRSTTEIKRLICRFMFLCAVTRPRYEFHRKVHFHRGQNWHLAICDWRTGAKKFKEPKSKNFWNETFKCQKGNIFAILLDKFVFAIKSIFLLQKNTTILV